MTDPQFPIVPVVNVTTHAAQFDAIIQELMVWAQGDTARRYIAFCAAYNVVMSHYDTRMQAIFENADLVLADGMPIVWLQRRRGFPAAERLYAPDVMEALCAATAGTGITHYLWGGRPEVTEKLVEVLQARFPGIKIAGYHAPPFAPVESRPDPTVIARINAAKPHIVWVCLGSGKQEPWMSMYRPHLDAPLILAVGAAFNFISGAVPQAPAWMQRNGLEWLFRLFMEPRHLAKRYLIYNPVFIYLVLRDELQRRFQKSAPAP